MENIDHITIQLRDKEIYFVVERFLIKQDGTDGEEKVKEIRIIDNIKIEVVTTERKLTYVNLPYYF